MFIWKRKIRLLEYRNDLTFTVPSTWMLNRAQRSRLLRNKDVRLLPNPIETQEFRPLIASQRIALRKQWGVDTDSLLVGFGGVGGEKNYIKGGHLLREAFLHLKTMLDDRTRRRIKVILFGGKITGPLDFEGFPAIGRGRISGKQGMREVYGAADFVVVPSLVESFGQVAAESLACETPVVAFASSGLTDIVQDDVSGYLAKAFDSYDLAVSLKRMICLSGQQRKAMGAAGRKRMIAQFSPEVVGRQFQQILDDVASRGAKIDA
jgi:glycosyltransferase involved in cell wall biosynthesis